MTSNEIGQIKPLLKEYVEKSLAVTELHWDNTSSSKLLFNPYSPVEKEKIAHYFLLVSALDTADLVSRSENTRAFIVSVHGALGDGLFQTNQSSRIQKITEEFSVFYELGPAKNIIPEVFESVNFFVENTANRSLVKFAKQFAEPQDFVEVLGERIPFLGGRYVDHAWMYLRWLVRPLPCLGVFDNFLCSQLKVPLTSFVRNVAFCLGICSSLVADWNNPSYVEQERNQLTEFAAQMFPGDPCAVDYPFYVLGRWINGEKLNSNTLKSHLVFWRKLNSQLNKPLITFDVVSRNESTFELKVREELEKLKVLFQFEPYPFSLPEKSGIPRYKPDFLLPRIKKNGKIVLLEPHGVWTPLERRVVSFGRETFPIMVNPSQIDPEESMFVNKLRVFRKTYKDMYYLILIVPSVVKERVARDYPDIYDELYDGADIPKLLYDLKKKSD